MTIKMHDDGKGFHFSATVVKEVSRDWIFGVKQQVKAPLDNREGDSVWSMDGDKMVCDFTFKRG